MHILRKLEAYGKSKNFFLMNWKAELVAKKNVMEHLEEKSMEHMIVSHLGFSYMIKIMNSLTKGSARSANLE